MGRSAYGTSLGSSGYSRTVTGVDDHTSVVITCTIQSLSSGEISARDISVLTALMKSLPGTILAMRRPFPVGSEPKPGGITLGKQDPHGDWWVKNDKNEWVKKDG
jgi:hypothetical protein